MSLIFALWLLDGSPGGRELPGIAVERMEAANARRLETLGDYRARRHYWVDHALIPRTFLIVEEHYRPGRARSFAVISRGGPEDIERRVFRPLLEAEQLNDVEPARSAVDINRHNYTFEFLRFDLRAGAYVFRLEPRTSNRYLFRGLIWIDQHDYAVQRIEGEPARSPSALVRRTRFVHEFQRSGLQWIQARHRSEVELLVPGRAVMGIDYSDYVWSK